MKYAKFQNYRIMEIKSFHENKKILMDKKLFLFVYKYATLEV